MLLSPHVRYCQLHLMTCSWEETAESVIDTTKNSNMQQWFSFKTKYVKKLTFAFDCRLVEFQHPLSEPCTIIRYLLFFLTWSTKINNSVASTESLFIHQQGKKFRKVHLIQFNIKSKYMILNLYSLSWGFSPFNISGRVLQRWQAVGGAPQVFSDCGADVDGADLHLCDNLLVSERDLLSEACLLWSICGYTQNDPLQSFSRTGGNGGEKR